MKVTPWAMIRDKKLKRRKNVEVKNWNVKYESGNTSFDIVCEGHRHKINVNGMLSFILEPEEGDPIITAQFAPDKWSMVKFEIE